jgi:hypothetical protein
MPSFDWIEFIIADEVDELYRKAALVTVAAAAFTGLDSPVFFTSGSATFISFVRGCRTGGAFTGFEEIADIVLSGAGGLGWLTGWLNTLLVILSLV